MKNSSNQIAIVGGGAAGCFAAANLAELCPNTEISIYESSSRLLSKVEVSGGGRCNVTHNCFDGGELSKSYPRGGQELRGPFSRFQPSDTIRWFKERGVELKTEADGRMFPVTDSSKTIMECLLRSADSNNVNIYRKKALQTITKTDDLFELKFSDGESTHAKYVMLATGGSRTGHDLAASLGHSITECAPSLFTFKSKDNRILDLAGISFPNSQVKLSMGDGPTFQQKGPVLITHWGLSGPAILKLSAFAARELFSAKYRAKVLINWIGEASFEECFDALTRARSELGRKEIGAHPQFLLTKRFWERIVSYCDISLQSKFSEVSNPKIQKLSEVLTRSEIEIDGKGEFKEEFVTCGGVNLKEIDFRAMESKLVPNLFFGGEILDIDGITGGFNFQAAWTAGWITAQSISSRER